MMEEQSGSVPVKPCGAHTVRKAVIGDGPAVQKLVNDFASRGLMLGLSLSDYYENIRDFFVAEVDGRIVGTCALHVIWEDLAEVRSLAVDPGCRELGIGRKLVEHCLAEAGSLRLLRVFALTYRPDFFSRLGFHPVEKAELPHKVWGHCTKCTKFPDCDEEAVTKILEREP
jgi:amino-acid N-acetyltransferase